MALATAELKPSTRGDLAVRFQKIKAQIHRQLVEGLDLSRLHQLKPERLRREVRELAIQLSQSTPELLNESERERIVEEIMDEAFGLGPLEAAMKDPSVSDILVNGPREVFLERGGRLELSDIVFADDNHVLQVIQRVAARVGRRVDEMSPMVDARLPDGSRVNAIIPPLALNGPVLSIRRFGVRLTADDLIHIGSMPEEVLNLLSACVQGRLNILISGGTGSGKTTLLNTLSAFIPHDERLVTIEDAAELKLQRPHVVRLETRPSNVEGSGEVRQRELVRNSLRMRPDRIIIGEVRGGEALDMLQAMNTGHEGSLTTIHANDTRDALARLEAMVMMASADLPIEVIRQYVTTALSVVVHLSRLKGGPRKVTRISEVVGIHRQRRTYVLKDLFCFRQLGIRDGAAYGEFYATGRVPRFLAKLKSMGIELPEEMFRERIIPLDTELFEAVQVSGDRSFAMFGNEQWIPLAAAFGTIAMIVFALWLFIASLRRGAPAAAVSDEPAETLAEMRTRMANGGGGFRRFIEGTGLDITPAGAVALVLFCGFLLAGAAYVWRMDTTDPWPLVITAFILGAAVPIAFLLFRRNQVRRIMRTQMPDVLFLLARSLRAGRTLDQAFQLIGQQGVPPLSLEFARMHRQLELGIALDHVVRGTADRLQIVDFNVFASVVSLHRATGGNLPVLLDRLAVSTRERIQFEGMYRSSTVLGRYSAALIGGMVAIILLYFFFLQSDPVQGSWVQRYFDTSVSYTGVTLFSVAIGFELLGILLMYLLLRGDY